MTTTVAKAVVKALKKQNLHIVFMESCTGGAFANTSSEE